MDELKDQRAKERSQAYAAVGRVVMLHRASESNARWAATRTALRFRDTGTRSLADDYGFLADLARNGFQVHECHIQLFVDVVRTLCRLLPETRDAVDAELLYAWKRAQEMEAMG